MNTIAHADTYIICIHPYVYRDTYTETQLMPEHERVRLRGCNVASVRPTHIHAHARGKLSQYASELTTVISLDTLLAIFLDRRELNRSKERN